MKTLYKILAGIGVVLVIVFAGEIGKLVGKFTADRFYTGKKETELNSVLMQTASQLNQNLPIMVDAETRLDSTVGINREFRYNYTMINYSAEEIETEAFTDAMQPRLINAVCTTKEMEVFVKNNIPVSYVYHGKNGKQFMTITVNLSQCK